MPNQKERKAMKAAIKRIPRKLSNWQLLRAQIAIYVQSVVDESWKGGGDPVDADALSLNAQLQRAILEAQITKMEREHE